MQGMISASDPLDVPPEAALYLENADFSRKLGALCKRPGFDIYTLAEGLPVDMGLILSLGWFPYIKVWNDAGETKINERRGRVIVQVNGEHGLDFYYRELNLDTGAWEAWSGLQSSLNYGATRADRIRWLVEPGVMRGVCGNWFDSFPIWIGYVDRNQTEGNGFFHDYTFNGGTPTEDKRTYSGLFSSVALPVISGGIKLIGKYLFGDAGYKNMAVRYLVVPIFDGHQVASLDQLEPISSAYGKILTVDMGANDVHRFNHLQLAVSWIHNSPPDSGPNPRLTGYNIYESHSAMTAHGLAMLVDPYDDWKLSRQIDLREGNALPVYKAEGTCDFTAGGHCTINVPFTDFLENDCFNDLWMEILIDENTIETYRVEDTTSEDPSQYTFLHFTSHANSQLQWAANYPIRLYERWKQVGTSNTFTIDLMLDGTGLSEQVPPEWLPAPNRVNDPTYKYPKIGANYRHAIMFEEMMIVGNVYFDGAKRPLDIMISNPINADFAGHDLYPDTITLDPLSDDEEMGFAQSLNILSLFTKYRIFRFTFDESGPRLLEAPYSIGLVAPDSLVTINGWHWFLGRHGPEVSVYRYDGIHAPEDMGAQIGDDLKAIIAASGVQLEHAIGWFDKRTQQYRLAINSYQS
jgi:hypothetical protein